MKKNTSISLGNYFEEFINHEVKSGKYSSVSEEKKEKELIKALEIGEQSGFVENFDSKQNLNELHHKYL